MKNTLLISKELSLPTDIVTQVEVILAKRRAGKSYTMRRIVEQLLNTSQQVVLVDPKGDQWGIRSSSDGKKPGFPVLILGGEHGDLPLETNGGEVVARLVVEERVSVLLDLSQFRKHELATFMTAFLENLYRLKAQEKYRTPVKLVVDEADAIAPQKPQKGEERMLGAIEDIVRRGGQRGIGCTLVTQRSAVLNKNVLTQAQMLVVLRTIAPQDIAAMKAWIDVHGTAEEGRTLIESLPSLPIGDAWFWSPGWPTEDGIFKRVHVLPIETFDSGATPKPGQKQIIPKNLADVDLDALKGQMAATIEKKKQEDPKELHRRIIDLEKQLSVQKNSNTVVASPMGVSQWMEYGRKYNYAEFFENKIRNEEQKKCAADIKRLQILINKMDDLFVAGRQLAGAEQLREASKQPVTILPESPPKTLPKKELLYVHTSRDADIAVDTADISGPEQRILDAVAWAQTIIQKPSNSLITFLAGYTNPKSTGYTNPRGTLTAKGLIEYPVPGTVVLTSIGRIIANEPESAGSEQELHRRVLSRLTGPQSRILKILLEERGGAIDNVALSAAAGYTNPKSTGYTNPRGELRSYGLIEYTPDGVRACNILFPSM